MIAPLLLQVKAMKEAGNKVTTILGARTKEFVMMQKEAKDMSDKFTLQLTMAPWVTKD